MVSRAQVNSSFGERKEPYRSDVSCLDREVYIKGEQSPVFDSNFVHNELKHKMSPRWVSSSVQLRIVKQVESHRYHPETLKPSMLLVEISTKIVPSRHS